MKTKFYLLILCYCYQFTLNAQEWNFITLPPDVEKMSGVGQLIDFSKNEDGYEALLLFEEPMKVEKTEEHFTAHLLISMHLNERFYCGNNYSIKILESPFMGFEEFRLINNTRSYVATQDDVITYAEALAKFPKLELKDLTKNIRKIATTEKFYDSRIETSTFGAVKGFLCNTFGQSKSKLEPEVDKEKKKKKKKKKKGLGNLMKKIATKMEDMDSKTKKRAPHKSSIPKYYLQDKINLDWSENYNGGQRKKAKWAVMNDYSCLKTGKLVAYNVHLGKETKGKNKDQEIVLFDRSGKTLKRVHFETEVNWDIAKPYPYYSHNNEIEQLEYVVFLNAQVGGNPKKNPNVNRQLYRVNIVNVLENTIEEFKFNVSNWLHEVLAVNVHGNGAFSIMIKVGDSFQKSFKFVHYSPTSKLELDANDFQKDLPENINLKSYDFVDANFDSEGNGSILFAEEKDKKNIVLFEVNSNGIEKSFVLKAEIGKRNKNLVNVQHQLLRLDNRKILILNYLNEVKLNKKITLTSLIELTGNEITHLLWHKDDVSYFNYTSDASFFQKINLFNIDSNLFFIGRRNTKTGLKNGILTSYQIKDN